MPKTVLRIGLDLRTALFGETGSFSRDPGFALSLLTGFHLFGNDKAAGNMGVELAYNKLSDYTPNVTGVYRSEYTYSYTVDQKHSLAFFEFALLPEFYYSINEITVIGIYAGAAAGIGRENLDVNYVVYEVIDSTYYPGGWSVPPLYGEYNMGPERFPISFSLGVILYWQSVVIDLRYKYTDMLDPESVHPVFRSTFLLVGVSL